MLTNAYLLWQFTKRDVQARYRGSALGVGWALISPLMLLGVFTLVFYGFFKLKWPVEATGGGHTGFALQVYAGLIVFNWLAEVISRGPTLVTSQPNLVTKVVFPLPVLPLASALAGGFQALISLALLMLVTLVLVGPAVSWLALPLLLAPFMLLLVGTGLWLAALGVYLRDIVPLMALVTSLLMFLSPVFYPLETVPAQWHSFYLLNPVALIIHELRHVLYVGQWPDWSALFWLSVAAAAITASGLWLFNRLRGGFADVL